MNKVTIDRELLEQVASEFEHDNDRYMLGRELRKVLAAPRQPDGDGLEVVGWHHSHAEVATSDKARVVTWLPECVEPLCRLSDAQRAIAELREECERLRMQLAACGVVALANTPESAGEARQMHPDYMSASCSDVADAVDREMALRQQLAERDAQISSMRAAVTPFIETYWRPVEHQRDKLADLLVEVKSDLSAAMNWGDLDRIAVRINAALAEVSK